MEPNVRAKRPQAANQQCGSRDTIHIVIAVDSDGLPLIDGAPDPLRRGAHIPHDERIHQMVQRRVEEGPRLFHVSDTSVDEDLGHHRGDLQLLPDALEQVWRRTFGNSPPRLRPAFQNGGAF